MRFTKLFFIRSFEKDYDRLPALMQKILTHNSCDSYKTRNISQRKGLFTMADEKGLAKGLLIGFLAGGVIGAVLALLYAPKSGRELREQLKTRGGELLDEAEDQVRAARSKAVDIINEGKKKADELIAEAKHRAESLQKDAEKILSEAMEKTGVIVEESGRIKSAIKAGLDAYKEERARG